MKNYTQLMVLLFPLLFCWGCAKETLDPNFTGSIEGRVLASDTSQPVVNAEVTTNPGTDVILTNDRGTFSFTDIPTGNYSIQIRKEGFATKTVRISVKENRVTSAQVLLNKGDDDTVTKDNLSAQVTFFENTGPSDSTYVDVEYQVKNLSGDRGVGHYEIYFRIFTNGTTFNQEVRGDSLAVGEQSFGTFRKYIREFQADSVTIQGIYTPA